MIITQSARKIVSKRLIDKLPKIPIDKQFFKDSNIDYELLQKHLIESHLIAFNYYELMLRTALECGSRENVLAANLGMITHSKQIVALSGVNYFADVNAAAAKLEREGYLISDESANT
ncbi:hypothetical protein H6G96_37445 [Nostoc sp. FACHB-892]|uniref:hypothetical protein n=1 Tax=Nostoc sp. FACHB-892 TaxID=2692843 RepID=UPI0016871DCD|nr:hypothetical protein [Nostoc sp. FACHB-892]MBD2731810.1 hypothetical protein [Nostoc sp. FACHB-892]